MPKSYGFTAIEIVFVIIVIAALGFAGWTWWQTQQNQERVTESSDTSQQHQGQGRNKTEQPSDSTDGWHQYQNSELGYTFRYPPEWSVDDDLNKLRSGSSHRYTGDKYAGVVLRSDVYREENKGIGGPYTVKGAKIRLLKSREFTGDDLTETFEKLETHLLTEGHLQPERIKVNDRSGVEYILAYEGPAMLITRHFISENHYVQTQLMTEGEETKHPA